MSNKDYLTQYRLKNKEKIKLQKQKYWREKTELIKQLMRKD